MLLLFPGYIVYHGLLAFNIIPDFLGGLYGLVSLFTGIIFILLLFNNINVVIKKKYSVITILFIFYILLYAFVNYLFSHNTHIDAALYQSLQITFLLFTLFFIGLFAPINEKKIYKIYYISHGILLISIISFVLATGSIFLSLEKYFVVENNISSYQGIARGALIILLVLISFSKTKWNLIFLVSSGIFVLFIIGARSEFYIFVIAVIFYGLIKMRYNPKLAISITILLLIGIIYFNSNVDVISSSRQLRVTDLSKDTSWLMRLEFRANAIDTILKNPILGDFGSHAKFGTVSNYSHDFLSAWVNYGIVGFLAYMSLIIWSTLASGYHILKFKNEQPYWNLSFLLNLVVLFSVLISKSVFWEIPALGWGIFLAAKLKATNNSIILSKSNLYNRHKNTN